MAVTDSVTAPPAWRAVMRRRMASESFDLAIIGGGITGAGIARDAALRGMRVALFEARDFASGTSSRSSRLIHGGVRYLEHGHLHLVFESSRERRALLRIAPHLVRPLPFLWPVYQGARISRLKLTLGLGLYDALSLFRNVARHDRLSRGEVLQREPQLVPDGLVGGARYYDAATDDSRLTLANTIAAMEAGAVVLNHASVTGLEFVGGRAKGLTGHDQVANEDFRVRAAQIVNATGPWTDEIRALEGHVQGPSVSGSRGAHIAVPRARVGNRDAVTMLHPHDGRVMFMLPAGDQAIIGTTETPVGTTEREPRASRGEVAYLLTAGNAYFPAAALGPGDVIAAWAGIRPLARQLADDDVGSASREHTIARGPRGVVHVTGGKLTTYREMAEQVVDLVQDHEAKRVRTASDPLPGGDRPLAEVRQQAAEAIGDDAVAERLAHAYGTRWREVWALEAHRDRLVAGHSLLRAAVVHAVTRELAVTLGDVLIRRIPVAFQMADQGRALAVAVADVMAPLLGWSIGDRDRALAAYDDEVARTFTVSSG